MGAYICLLCDKMFCHHSVGCYEYRGGLICEDCHLDITQPVEEPDNNLNSYEQEEHCGDS